MLAKVNPQLTLDLLLLKPHLPWKLRLRGQIGLLPLPEGLLVRLGLVLLPELSGLVIATMVILHLRLFCFFLLD